jgi:pimeloyl-ACP methyl ester carboxylesterase
MSTEAAIPNELSLFPEGTRMHEGTLRSGLRVRWYERGDRTRPCVLLMHGFPELALSWRKQLEGLSDEYFVVAPDMRAFGGSEGPYWFWRYTLGQLARDPVDLLALLEISQAHLVGHDWGAAVAWETAARHPQHFRSLSIVNCPPLSFLYRHVDKQMVRSSYALKMLVPYLWNHDAKRRPEVYVRAAFHIDKEHERVFSESDIAAYSRHMARGMRSINYYRAGMLLPPLRLRRVTLPTRLVWGMADPWVNAWFGEPAHYSSFVDRIDAVQLPGVGHFAQQQAPAQVNDALREHFRKHDHQT